MSNFSEITRLILALLCFGVGLLAVIPVQWIPLWMLSIGATEFGHWFAIAPLLVLGFSSFHTLAGKITTLLAVAAVALFLTTVVRAIPVARALPDQLAAAFGPSTRFAQENPGRQPISLAKLWTGESGSAITAEAFIYAEHDGEALRLNFYRSSTSTASPCVIVLHTGGWNSGSPNEFLSFNAHLARHGYAVAAMEYRLAPKWKWPAQRDDTLDVIHYLKTNAVKLGIDPTQFVLLGRSAGGHIAETVAYEAHDPAIRGCIAFYAPADMHFAYKYAREDDILKSPQLLRNFLGGTPDEASQNYDSASSILHVDKNTPPTLLFHGTIDRLVWFQQSKRLAAKLNDAGVPHLFVELPWATHAFDFNPNGPGGQISTYAIDYFLDVVTQR